MKLWLLIFLWLMTMGSGVGIGLVLTGPIVLEDAVLERAHQAGMAVGGQLCQGRA